MFNNVGTKDRLIDRVVDEIQRQIIEGGLHPGLMLPPERQLCEQLGVSRTVLREAVRMLASKGLLETRPGIGSVVMEVKSDQLTETIQFMLKQDKTLTFLHLHQVRSMLEVNIARLAALNASPEDIQELHRLMAEMEAILDEDPIKFSLLDAEYHNALAKATQNPLLELLLTSIRGLFLEIITKIQVRAHQVKYTIPDHKRIVREVEQSNPEGAAQAMREHLEHALFIMQEQFFLD